jgi:hypothetical protein
LPSAGEHGPPARIEPSSPAHQLLVAIEQLQPGASVDNLEQSGLIEGPRSQILQTGALLEEHGLARRLTVQNQDFLVITNAGRQAQRELGEKGPARAD